MLQKVGRNLFNIFAWFACKNLVGILTLLLPSKSIQMFYGNVSSSL